MYDVIIIGAGPGGYTAAQRLAQNGKSVALIEKTAIGGTCLNVGCIPTKTLLNSAKHYVHARNASQFGIHAQNVSFHFDEIMKWKEQTVATLKNGVTSMLKKLRVEIISGTAVITAKNTVKIAESGTQYEAKALIIATGSHPIQLPIDGVSGNPYVVDSTGILAVSELPRTLCIIGAGIIGIEFASLFASLGTSVSVIESAHEIVAAMDCELSVVLRKTLTNVDFYLQSTVEKINGNSVHFKNAHGESTAIQADIILTATGRKASTSALCASDITLDSTASDITLDSTASDITLDSTASGITVDDHMRTNIDGIWAIGDVTGRSMLAHAAYRMAEVAVADIIASQSGKSSQDSMKWNAIPWVVYGITEAAGVGITEQQAQENHISVKKITVPLSLSGRFIAENGIKGIGALKIISNAQNGHILGIHIVAPYASELIWGAAALLENDYTIDKAQKLIFPHPTIGEIIRDALWMIQ